MAIGLPPLEEKAASVEEMFDRIAPRYDRMNRVLTAFLDRHWRRVAARLAQIGPGDLIVDLGCGTGDMCEIAARAGARAVGIDFAAGMLAVARRRHIPARIVRADACRLPLGDASATVVTCTFALRNFLSIPQVLREAARVLAQGGRLALLEVDEPRTPLARRAFRAYFHHVVPWLGALLSDRRAYRYLPNSTAYLPSESQMLGMIGQAGFTKISKHRLSGGISQLIVAIRSPSEE